MATEQRGLDPVGWFIAASHQALGHDKAALVCGVIPGPRAGCLLCLYEAEPSPANRVAVEAALAPKET